MRPTELLSTLAGRGVALWTEDGFLRYQAPAGAITPALRAAMIEQKEALLALLGVPASQGGPSAPLAQRRADASLVMSHAQERLWLLEQIQPGNLAYKMSWAIRIRGPLHVGALERALLEIIRRHEVLRTTFEFRKGHPALQVHPTNQNEIRRIDLRNLRFDDGKIRLSELRLTEAERSFDLARDRLIRMSLIVLRDDEHVLLLTLHHIVFDGWSVGVFMKEFDLLYESFALGRESPLKELPLQYSDYAAWQREWLRAGVLEQQLRYWKKTLAGMVILDLPTDRPRPARTSYRGDACQVAVARSLATTLEALSREHGVTLFILLSAAFKILLQRYSGRDDISVGTAIANRTRKETEVLIGFFVNTLLLRTDLSGNPTFVELLAREREVVLGAYDNQDTPFERVVEELQPERDLSRSPLFGVMFVLQNAPREQLRANALEFELMPGDQKTAKFDLLLSLSRTNLGLNGILEYRTDLFDRETVERLVAYLQQLLAAIVANPMSRLSELPALNGNESRPLQRDIGKPLEARPRSQSSDDGQTERAPTPTEKLLIDIWKEVLKVDGIGRLDNFFEKGGHSLAGVFVLSRVEELTQVKLDLGMLFETPTLAAFAERIEAARSHTRVDVA
jgi:hypothetical protein